MTTRKRGDDRRCRLWLAAILAGAALLRLLYLGAKSLWLDEGATYAIVAGYATGGTAGSWAGFVDAAFRHEANMALYYLLLRGWLHLGESEFMIRVLSAVAGIATVPVLYLLGKRLFDRRTGLLSALFFAVHTAHVTYSQQARSYSLAVLLCALATYFFVRAVESGAIRDWALYAACAAFAVYAHFFASLVIIAQLASLVALPGRAIPWRRLLPSLLALAALTVPAALLVMHGASGGQVNWISPASYKQLPNVLTLLAGNPLVLPVYIVLWAAVAGLIQRTWAQFGRSQPAWHATVLLSWAIVPSLLLYLASLARPMFVARYLLISAPAAVLLAARGTLELRLRPRLLLGSAVVLLSIGATVFYQSRPREDWRGATAYILTNLQPGDGVLVLPPASRWPFIYYQRRSRSTLAVEAPLNAAPTAAWLDGVAVYPRLWVLLYGRAGSDPVASAYSSALARSFPLQSTRRFTMIDVQVYAPAGTGKRPGANSP